ncbi:MAG: CsgG/HfaB family protein [Pseudomonadota bacterium]
MNQLCLGFKFIIVNLLVGCAFFLGACTQVVPPYVFLKQNFDIYQVKKIAVLPFSNDTEFKNAGEIVTRAFVQKLFETGKWKVEFQGNLQMLLVGERITPRNGIGVKELQIIGKRLNVDAVVAGSVKQYGENLDDEGIPEISISARMIHSESGVIIWMGEGQRSGRDYETILGRGRVRSGPELVRKVVQELVATIP